jgi:hypothetical protein
VLSLGLSVLIFPNALQGCANVDGEKIADIKKTYTVADFADGKLLCRGKKNFRKVILK